MKSAKTLIIADYDPGWVDEFRTLSLVIMRSLPAGVDRIEHVGSTSVPGLAAKPIIDLDIVISHQQHLVQVVKNLDRLGYEHQGDKGIEGRESFRARTRCVPITSPSRWWRHHHLYVCVDGSVPLVEHVTFRDWLRRHPKDRDGYAMLKRSLARIHFDDREAYTEAKSVFIRSVIQNAISHNPKAMQGGGS